MRLVYPDEVIEPAHYDGLTTEWFEYDQVMNQLCVCLNDGEASYYLYIPAEYIK